MKIAFFFLLITTLLNANTTINSFSKSKKLLKKIYKNNQVTFYAGCSYKYKKNKKSNMIDYKSCNYTPRNTYTKKGNINKRAKRIEWEHVIPAENFGRAFSCWRDGNVMCISKKGKKYKGRKCCTKVNKTFRLMQADLHNLVPSIGELNADRSNFKYASISGEKRVYGEVDFEVDFKARKVEPKEDIRGNIARTYFYFQKNYGLKISKQQQNLLNIWNKKDKVDSWEIKRNKLISKIQGNKNKFIK